MINPALSEVIILVNFVLCLDKMSVIHFKFCCSAELLKTYTVFQKMVKDCLDLPLQEASTYDTTCVKLGTKIFALNLDSIAET